MFISWMAHHGRSETLARELGVEPVFIAMGRTGNRRTALPRHMAQTAATVVLLVRRRPARVFVMAPPTTLVAIAAAYAWVARATLGIDAHTGALIGAGDERPALMRRLVRRARVTLVTSDNLARLVRGAGGRPVVVHNPPPAEVPETQPPSDVGVLVPCGWAPDEPLDVVVGAAELLPETTFSLTGAPRRGMLDGTLPGNVHLLGHLDAGAYERALAGAEVVLALTTRPMTMQQGGYEALAHGRPLVVSDTAVLRDYFDDAAVYAAADPRAVADAVTEARRRSVGLSTRMRQLAATRRAEFDIARAAVAAAMGGSLR